MTATPTPTHARPRAGHDTLVVTITPSHAQAYGQCPLYFSAVYQARPPHLATRAIQRGRHVHSLIERYTRALIEGHPLGVDAVIARVPVPPAFRDGGDDEQDAIDHARVGLRGYETWLEERRFATIVAAEQYFRTPPRPVAGVDGAALVFSGRVDLVALTRDNTLALVDFKSSSILTPEALHRAPSSFVYRHLGMWAYGHDDIEISQVVPATGHEVSVRLEPGHVEAGAALCRSMMASIKEQSFPARPGAYCAYCDHAARCPAFAGRGDIASTAF